jgi:hypothetical protein
MPEHLQTKPKQECGFMDTEIQICVIFTRQIIYLCIMYVFG